MDTYAHGYGSTGHYAKPGTHTSYCGRELQHTPNTPVAARICTPCAKAEKRDRVEAEQVAADRATDGPTLAERARVRYATVGTGRRIHFSPNDDTLCGREITEYISGADLLALFNKGRELCTPCIKAAEQRAYALSLAAVSPLAAAAVDLASTIEQADAESEQEVAEAEAQQAAALVTEAEPTDGTWRGEWIGEQPADSVLFHVEAGAEQGALFDDRLDALLASSQQRNAEVDAMLAEVRALGAEVDDYAASVAEWGAKVDALVAEREATSPAKLTACMQFEPSAVERVKAKADADRAAYRAEMDDRQAAEHHAHGAPVPPGVQSRIDARTPLAEQAVEPRVVEGVIVAHNGRTKGTAPKHSTDPDALAALGALGTLRCAEVTDHTDISAHPGDVGHTPEAWGFLVEPRGNGRVALCWVQGGRYVDPSGEPWAVELEIGADKLRKAGWQIEPMTRRCVFAWRPTE
ncbi:hypothetical protein A8W25_22260 [Streptomyces sp. ERV7]|uniref:hypothetical protein n=1 Tax=Streptomyces sp. ERV7 TaxID=1322334 RepID=UPI0007F3AAD1|nr:hypothetical protein [Streptomyces sp. ERV7]OAR22380.1 hypothetical protein A8W25_22260 [Streptomyces sp. ERV7]